MALRLVLNHKISAFAASELSRAGLLGVEMVETGFAGNDFAVLGNLQSL